MIDHKSKTLSDKITVIGNLEHIYYHAKKSAGVVDNEELETFYLTIAQMAKDFRRAYMKRHFPDCPDELWCLVKATETARQRVYEADEGDVEDIKGVDAIWANVMEKLTGQDLSGCSSCREDKGEIPNDDKIHYYDAIALTDTLCRAQGQTYRISVQVRNPGKVFDEEIEVHWLGGPHHDIVSMVYEGRELFERDWQVVKEIKGD